MNKFNKRFFSLLLAFVMILSPVANIASPLDLSVTVEENGEGVGIRLVGEKNEKASISIKNKDKYFFLDEKILDDKGILEFKVNLPKGATYKLLVNVAGVKQEKIIDLKDQETGTPTPIEDRVELTINGYRGEILRGEYRIEKDDTVLSFTKRILDDKKISYEDRGGYIASIDGQSELDKGKNSGWIYKLNGKMPNEGAGSVKLGKGDSLVWEYTYDYVEDGGLGSPIKDRDQVNKELDRMGKELEKEEIKDLDKLADELDKNLGHALDKDRATVEKAVDLSIKLNNKLQDTSKKTKENIVSISKDEDIVLTKDFIQVMKDKKVDKLSLQSKKIKLDIKTKTLDSKEDIRISLARGESLKIDISSKGKKLDKLDEKMKLVWPIENIKDGNRLRIKSKDGEILGGIYDEKTKTMVFLSDKTGEFLVEEGDISFKDTKNHWAEKEIEALANKNIIKGKAKDKFLPNTDISRGEFVAIINRMMKYEKTVSKNKFSDISKDDWYYEDINIVSSLGIVRGKDNNKFEPDSKISREEMATIVGRILQSEAYNSGDREILNRYEDKDRISGWAEEGLVYLSEHEILKGDSKNRMNPKANATRAEAGVILYRLYKLILFN